MEKGSVVQWSGSTTMGSDLAGSILCLRVYGRSRRNPHPQSQRRTSLDSNEKVFSFFFWQVPKHLVTPVQPVRRVGGVQTP